ncbi:unnamed protein product, partial [Oppiella nova]
DIEAATYFDVLTNQILRERKHNNKYTNSRRTDFVQLMIDSEKSNRDLGYDSSSDVDPTPEEESQTAGKPKGSLTPDELTAQGMLLYIAGITIPAGTSVEIYPYAIHRDPEYWPNPDDFIPDRWFEPTHHPLAFQAFGAGPRVCIGQRYLRHRFTYWARHGVPGPNHMEFGAMVQPHHEYTQWAYKKYGRVYGSYDLTRRTIAVNDPELLKDIMIKDFHIFPDHKHFNTGNSKINLSIFFLPGNDQWKRIRSLMGPAFTSGKLKAMMAHISDLSDKFIGNMDKYAKSGEPFNIRELVGCFAMDVISACAYGISIDSLNNPDHPVVTHAKRILGADTTWRQVVGILAPNLAKFFKMEFFDIEAATYFDVLTNQILRERKHNNKYTNSRRTDFVQLMIDSEKYTGTSFAL